MPTAIKVVRRVIPPSGDGMESPGMESPVVGVAPTTMNSRAAHKLGQVAWALQSGCLLQP